MSQREAVFLCTPASLARAVGVTRSPLAWSLLRASKRASSALLRLLRLAASRLATRLGREALRPRLLASSTSSPLRGSTRARAAGDSRLRSGLPVPDTGQTRVPR